MATSTSERAASNKNAKAPKMHKTKIDIPADQRVELVSLLNETLATILDLKLQAKQAHWNVRGATFLQLHELFDKIAGSADEYADTIAERAGNLGGFVDGTVSTVGDKTKLAPYPTGISAGEDHVESLSKALAAAGKQIRAAIDQAEKIGDADTVDLYTGISRGIDQYLWFVEAHAQ